MGSRQYAKPEIKGIKPVRVSSDIWTHSLLWPHLLTSSQSEITDAPVFYFFIFVINVLFELFVLLYFVIWSDSPYELPSQI